MYCFESKYALCLYEMIERRIGLEYKQSEEFTIAELRGLLNVPEGKLERFADFNKGSVAKIVKLEHAWRRLDGRNDDGFQVAPFTGRCDPVGGTLVVRTEKH